MEENYSKSSSSIWKRVEKFFGIVGFIAAIAGVIGVYYQFQNKKSEVKFIVLSKDYLTVKNNIEGLESDYKYAGQPVKNLWLLKFKIINSGDQTLIGTNKSSSLLDTSIVFKFRPNIEILHNAKQLESNFPEHKIKQFGKNYLNLTFQQWRQNESAIYSVYIKCDNRNPNLLPTAARIIKDGNILVEDLTDKTSKVSQPLIDTYFEKPFATVARILGIILGSLIFLGVNFILFGLMLPGWLRYRMWLMKNKIDFQNFLLNYDSTKIGNKNKYLLDPSELYDRVFWKDWEKTGKKEIPDTGSTPTTWKGFFIWMIVIIAMEACCLSIITGLYLV